MELTRDGLLDAILSAKRLEDLQQLVRNAMVEHLVGKPLWPANQPQLGLPPVPGLPSLPRL